MWSLCLVLLLFCCVCCLMAENQDKYACNTLSGYAAPKNVDGCVYNPDIGDDVPNIISRHGYNSTIYKTITQDGYVLNVIRFSTNKRPTKGVVFLQHPYAIGSVVWVDKGNISLAFHLVDLGYDVWLGNSRGTKLSPKHISLTWQEAKYWDYSFHEIAVYDFPAMLHLVKNITNSKVIFIGYSAGGTAAFIFASALKDKAVKYVDLFVTISPALTLGKTFTAVSPILKKISAVIGEAKIHNIWRFIFRFLQRYVPALLPPLFYISSGITSREIYPPFFALILYAMPDGANFKQADHYAQITVSKKFRNYDYGKKKNQVLYDNEEPPEYPLKNIEVPFHIIYGTRDTFFGPKDAELLYNKLSPSATYGKPYNIGSFNHMQFGYGKEVHKLNEYISRLLNARSSNKYKSDPVTK